MTLATVTTRYDSVPLAVEHVRLTLTDDYTFVSKLSAPAFCHITSAEDMGSETNSISYSISSRTITFYGAGVSGKLAAVSVYGRL